MLAAGCCSARGWVSAWHTAQALAAFPCTGLCCAALLAKYGYRVTVCESHYLAGGAAHGFETRAPDGSTYHFDAGPSFFAGISGEEHKWAALLSMSVPLLEKLVLRQEL